MKALVKTYGCKVNQYESQLIRENLERQGYILSQNGDADVVVVNTCCVTERAEKKARSFIRKAVANGKRVLVTGCAVRKQKSLVEEFGSSIEVYPDKDALIRTVCPSGLTTISRFDNHTRAFIKIEDGCENFCTFCIIPLVRGRVKSRLIRDVVREVRDVASNGYKEVVLTGVDLGAYGSDTGEKMTDLMKDMEVIEGLKRIRLSSIEVFHLTEELLKYLSNSRSFCRHFHIPLQSGSDRILKKMGRRYTFSEYLSRIERIKGSDAAGRVTFTTDVMVGFPGETEEDFNLTCEALKRIRFLRVHIFRYSRREGTAASRMDGQVPEDVKKKREKELEDVVDKMCYNVKEGFIGRPLDVLVERETDNLCEGYSSEYIPVAFTGGKGLLNKVVTVTGREVVKKGLVLSAREG
jgi:threonylcarbamoyladenosine tRNA methylthiotransferase MtaB